MLSEDKILGARLESLENGVHQLDGRVAALDDKVSHVIQMNSELMIQSNENFREMRGQLEEHRTDMKKSLRSIRNYRSTKCQLIGFGSGLAAWTFFMVWVMWG